MRATISEAMASREDVRIDDGHVLAQKNRHAVDRF
jgi:hypothetical protein